MEIDAFLKEWALSFIKYKDTVSKAIKQIKDVKNHDFVVERHEGETYYLVRGELETTDELLSLLEGGRAPVHVIMINSKKNLIFLIKKWKSLCTHKWLSLYFVNPYSANDKYWVIRPYIHSRVCDEDSLEAGLKAMFQSVEETDEDKLQKAIKTKEL